MQKTLRNTGRMTGERRCRDNYLVPSTMTDSQKVVTPVKTGVQVFYNYLNLHEFYWILPRY